MLKMNRSMKIVKTITVIVLSLVYIGVIIQLNRHPAGTLHKTHRMDFETASVLEVIDDKTIIDERFAIEIQHGTVLLYVELLSGRFAGEKGVITNELSPTNQLDVGVSDQISVRVGDVAEGRFEVFLHNYDRRMMLFLVVAIFFLTLGFVGGKKGIKSILGLIATLVNVIFLMIPLLLRGYNPLFISVLVLAVTTLQTLLFLTGWSKKTLVAFTGCISGVVVAALFASGVGQLARLSGMNMEAAEALVMITLDMPLQVNGLFISSVLVASLGAVMDIGMTIASSSHELTVISPDISQKKIFSAGLNIGRDAIGTMSSTLILAFMGTALNMLIIFLAHGISFNQLINTDFLAIEIVRSVAGSMGIVLTVPITCLLASKFMTKKQSTKGG